MRNIGFPFRFDGRGRTACVSDVQHVRDMIEQLLLTSPGERVNRPDFGVGLLQLLFTPNSPELATAVQFAVQGALQRHLGDLLDAQTPVVTAEDSTLAAEVAYVLRGTGEQLRLRLAGKGTP